MKFIKTYKSPNFNTRKDPKKIKYIIIHYTAMLSDLEALKHMCSKSSKVSSHFLVNKAGNIYELVDIKKRAWHAGKSYWKNTIDINSLSIGIEIDNSGHLNKFEKYPKKQIDSLIKLVKKLRIVYKISRHNILGHSDVAPYRKIDPGEKFPWIELNKKNLCYLPFKKQQQTKTYQDSKSIILDNNYKNKTLKMLKYIGYDTRNLNKKSKKFTNLILNYQRHYFQERVTGKLDLKTYEIINKHYKDLLTNI